MTDHDYADDPSDRQLFEFLTSQVYDGRKIHSTKNLYKEQRGYWKRRLYGVSASPDDFVTPSVDYLRECRLEIRGRLRWRDDEMRARILDGVTNDWRAETLLQYFDAEDVSLFFKRRRYILAMCIEQGKEWKACGLTNKDARDAAVRTMERAEWCVRYLKTAQNW